MRRRGILVGGIAVSLSGCITVQMPDDGDTNEGTRARQEQRGGPDSPDNSHESESSDPGTGASADFTILSMAPMEGYLVSCRISIGDADEVVMIHQNDVIESYESDGNHQIAGDDDEPAPMHYEEVEWGDRFAAVAMVGDEEVETLAEEKAVS